jgi:glutathione S-transferase
MSKYTVVGLPQSTCTRRVLTVLEEKGVAYDIRRVDFGAGENKTEEYKQKFHPFGRIPALIDGDFKLIESRAISRYIAENNASGTSLIPSDAKARGQMDQWIFVELCEFAPAEKIVKELYFKKFYGQTAVQEVVTEETQKLHTTLKVMDAHLKNNQYLAGQQFTIAGQSFHI